MKRNLIGISILSAAFVLTAGHLAAAEIMLEALNPRGEITLPPLTAQRSHYRTRRQEDRALLEWKSRRKSLLEWY
jgi:hypothetical protein